MFIPISRAFLIYLRYHPSKRDQPTRQLNCQRLLQSIDELFVVLLRLFLNLLEKDLSHRFNYSQSTVSCVCTSTTWLPFLSSQLYPLITWPSSELINHYIPAPFKDMYPTTGVIIAQKYLSKLHPLLISNHLLGHLTNIITPLRV